MQRLLILRHAHLHGGSAIFVVQLLRFECSSADLVLSAVTAEPEVDDPSLSASVAQIDVSERLSRTTYIHTHIYIYIYKSINTKINTHTYI